MTTNIANVASAHAMSGNKLGILPDSLSPRKILSKPTINLYTPKITQDIRIKKIPTEELRFAHLRDNFIVDFAAYSPSMDINATLNEYTLHNAKALSHRMLDFAAHMIISESMKLPRNSRNRRNLKIDNVRRMLEDPSRSFKPTKFKPKSPRLGS